MATGVIETTPVENKAPLARRRAGLFSTVFTPNATVTSSVYNMLLAAWAVILLAGWFVLPGIFPTPMEALHALMELFSGGGLFGEIIISLWLNVEALFLSTIIALGLSYSIAIPAFRPFVRFVGNTRFLPLVGLSFFFTVLTGGGHALKLSLLTFGMVVFFVRSMADAVEQVPESKIDYIRSMRAGPWKTLWQGRILGTIGAAFDTLANNAAIGWIMLTAVEGIVRAEGGIGLVLVDSNKHFDRPDIFAMLLVFLLIGMGQDWLIRSAKGWFFPFTTLSYKK